MIRSTPSSSGSGNMTPASMRIAVSPQATTIMFMPNSPSPPSGISSSGGDIGRRVVASSDHQVKAPRIAGSTASATARRVSRRADSRRTGHARRATRAGGTGVYCGGEPRLVCPPGAAGTARPGTAAKAAQTIAQLARGRSEKVRKPRQLCQLQRLGTAPPDRSRRASRPRGASRAGRRVGRSAFDERLAPLHEHRADHRLERRFVRHRDGAAAETAAGRRPNEPSGARPEGAGRQRQQRPHVGVQLHEDRQHAVVAASRAARSMRSATSRCSIRVASTSRPRRRCASMSANRIGEDDVVGKVAGDADGRSDGERVEIELEEVRLRRASRSAAACGAATRPSRRSISMAVSRATRGASRERQRSGPGPISRKRSSGCGSIAATTLSAHAASQEMLAVSLLRRAC